ncbi:nickel transporter permease [Halococcus sp. IIIV-5B]|uniref:nickel transporter permease n=1 Tax=Halococcus sp. IIIV-5B TaxID=2321230 RepID=UPI000E712E23|nr:nickel transporter permease [Halococcus sp. IIIV-5B]RJT07419.1 ABC transporter permease [Halococcus sp. IIIV-5B]
MNSLCSHILELALRKPVAAVERLLGVQRTKVLLSHRKVRFGGGIIGVLVVAAILGPVVSPYDPTAQVLNERLSPPSLMHPLGTDTLGRDIATRLVYGARISLSLAVAVTAVRVGIGTTVGVLAGYVGGSVDTVLSRVVDIQLAFPGLVLALAVAGILSPGLWSLLLAVSVVGWASYARVARSSTLSVKQQPFVQAAKLYGTPRRRIVRRHLFPTVVNPIIVLAALDLGMVVITTATLSFLGLGAQPPTAEWGTMVEAGRDHLRAAWWLVATPAIVIAATVIGFNLLGDGLQDVLDSGHQAVGERRET